MIYPTAFFIMVDKKMDVSTPKFLHFSVSAIILLCALWSSLFVPDPYYGYMWCI